MSGLGLTGSTASAQTSRRGSRSRNEEASVEPRVGFDLPETNRWQIGLKLKAGSTCEAVTATFCAPVAWPEQQVRLVSKDIDPAVRGWGYRTYFNGKARQPSSKPGVATTTQIVLKIPKLAAGTSTKALFEFDVTKSRINAPMQTDDLTLFKKLPPDLRQYLGDSKPTIDASHRTIKDVHKELTSEPYDNTWQLVERFYDYVRENVRYVNGPTKRASQALRDGDGDCEEMTSLVVALCRNTKIPARMVWVPNHCYPEFCLADPDGNPHWFPCQAAGTRQFGRMEDYGPILQKGDRFRTPEKINEGPQRYLTEFFSCDVRGKSNPRPEFVLKRVEV